VPRRPKATLGRAIDEMLNALERLDNHSRRVALRVAAFHFGLIGPHDDPFRDVEAESAASTNRPEQLHTAASVHPLPVRRRGRPRKIQIPARAGSAPPAAGVPMNEEVPDV
jgi:hypothetical protein